MPELVERLARLKLERLKNIRDHDEVIAELVTRAAARQVSGDDR